MASITPWVVHIKIKKTDNNQSEMVHKFPSTIVAKTVYHFLHGGIYGAAFGLVRDLIDYLHCLKWEHALILHGCIIS
jgi:hypothetical protein